MASILRQLVAGPRLRHPEARLDLCYVTDDIIATSGPSSTYPKRAYRNPTDSLVRFLDSKHGEDWSIWEFRAEGTGYPDEEVYGRIHHFPWPDHHPPPFAHIPPMMASMRNWLSGNGKGKRVAVVHCKAGKGRSGTVACSYLVSEQGWKAEDALRQFTLRRMRVGFGPGVSIPSQLRYVGYVDRWKNEFNKRYVERPVEILEIHIWGLRNGLKVQVEGYVDEGRKIKRFHRFHRRERIRDGDESATSESTSAEATPRSVSPPARSLTDPEPITKIVENVGWFSKASPPEAAYSCVILRPEKKLIIPSSDVNIDFERRAGAGYGSWTMVTSVAHVWFNAYFEGGHEHDSGVFEADWDSLDGIKGTSSKGTRALDRLKVVWRYAAPDEAVPEGGKVISEPAPGETVAEGHAADWRGNNVVTEGNGDTASESDDESSSKKVQHQSGRDQMPQSPTTNVSSPSSPRNSLMSWSGNKQGQRRQSNPTAGLNLLHASGKFETAEDGDASGPLESSTDTTHKSAQEQNKQPAKKDGKGA